MITFNTTLYGPASTLLGLERAAHAEGYFVGIVSLESLERTRGDRGDRAAARAVASPASSSSRRTWPRRGGLWDLPGDVPVVAVEAGPEDGVAVAAVDQYEGARLATQHLLDLGHATVRHIAGPADWLEAQRRIDGWRDALDAAGRQEHAAAARRLEPALGLRARAPAARGRRDVTAVFVANDQMALGLLRALHEQGRDVPGDVSVVGFDDIPEAEFFTPPLTTVRQDFNEMGRRSLHLLLDQIAAGERSQTRVTVPAELVERASTAASARQAGPA